MDDPTGTAVDLAALFAALPTAYLVMDPDLVIVAVNDAYCRVTGRRRDDVVGRYVFDAFPANPGDVEGEARLAAVKDSFERARDTQQPHTMDVLKYDIPDVEAGGFVERYWSLISVPVLGEDGKTALVVQRTEDITEYLREVEAGRGEVRTQSRLRQEAEADLFARAQELRAARDAEAEAARRLSELAGVALQLSCAGDVAEAVDVIIGRGLVALGADGGSVAVATDDPEVLHTTTWLPSPEPGGRPQVSDQAVLPTSVAARTGRRVLLAGEPSGLAGSAEVAQLVERTGAVASASFPLRVGSRVLGALGLLWRREQVFAPQDVDLMEAFAVQCAQTLDRLQVHQAERAAAAEVRRTSEALQRSLLSEPPHQEALEVAVRYQPAAHEAQVGGDWYDAFVLADGTTLLVVGDVAGHDREAAAGMAQVRNVLRGVAHALAAPPAAVLSALDRALRDLGVTSLATAVLATLGPQPVDAGGDAQGDGAWLLRWSNAGHPPPVLITPEGTAEVLAVEPDLLLGLAATTTRTDHERVLPPGSTVLLYTDGLVERRGADIDTGVEWLRGAAQELAGAELPALCDCLLAQVDGVEDDVALLAVRTS